MACIQPSFLHPYLFRTQYNTSFLLTSKDELKYPRGSFLNNSNFYPFGQQHFPLKNNSKPSRQFFQYIRDQDFAHILAFLISKHSFQISKITFSKTKSNPISGGIPLTSQYFNTTRFSILFLGEFTKYPARQIFSNFLDPSLEETSTKPGMPTSTQNIDAILGRLHKTLPISTIFPNSTPSHSLNYGSKGIWAFSRQHHASKSPQISD